MIQINDLNLNNFCDSALGRVDANELNAIVGGAGPNITSGTSAVSGMSGDSSMELQQMKQQSELSRQFQLQTSQMQAQQVQQQMQLKAYGALRNANG
jgi:hypothetical protein